MSIPQQMLATYAIEREIARGGMSTVYLARHRRLHTLWAVKEVLRADFPRFDLLAEANILKQLHHPMLPHIADVFETPEAVYLVEEYLEGQNLRQLVEEKGPLPEQTVREWALALCDVLDYLHSHTPAIIYRDMKPANIMRMPDGTLKLVDFGIARTYKRSSVSDTTFAGTRGYAAPEQFSGRQTDPRTDLYSLGVTLYYLLTGKSPADQPYELLPLRQVNPAFSQAMEEIVGRCTRPEPEDRYQNVGQLRAALQAAGHSSARTARKKRRRTLQLAAGGVAVLAALAGTGLFVRQYRAEARLKEMDTLYADALADLNESREAAAVEKLQTLLTMDPGRGEACLALGNAYLAQAQALPQQEEGRDTLYEQARTQYEKAEALGSGEAPARLEALQQAREETQAYRRQLELLAAAYDTLASRDWEAMKALLMQQEYQNLLHRGQTDPLVYDEQGENVLAVYPSPYTEYDETSPGFYYCGGWQDGQRTGSGLWYYVDDQTIYYYDGQWADDLPNGSGVVYAAENLEQGQSGFGTVSVLWEESTGNFVDGYFDGMFRVRNEAGDGTLLDVQMDHDMGYHLPIAYEDLPAECRALYSREDFDELEAQGGFVKAVGTVDNGDIMLLFGTPEECCKVLGANAGE